jgi:DNA-binding NtrC family response regulator
MSGDPKMRVVWGTLLVQVPMAVDLQPTDQLSWTQQPRVGGEKTFSLLVVRDGETSTYPLPASGTVLIGRSSQANVQIDHRSVSREHAALHLGEALRIEDLGSANGTRVRDTPLTPGTQVEIFPDDVIDLGAVLLVVQYRQLEQRLRRSCDHAFFELRVEEECERAASGDANVRFALVRLDVDGGLGTHAVQLLLASELAREDLISSSGPGKYEVMLTGVSRASAEKRAELLTQGLNQRALAVRSRFLHFPSDSQKASDFLGRQPELRGSASFRAARADVVVHDESMLRVHRLLERVADSELSVILLGETGVGKEQCAELVHELSPRTGKRFLRLNCASLSESLLESELFGYERGAFTGALTDKPGLLEAASGGSVFLDEVGDMPLATQVKLLRVLEAREVLRLGARAPRAIDIRLIAATHQDLNERITDGLFREDLYYRLNGISVIVPPLRERIDDIEPLARHFLARFAKKGRTPPTLSSDAVDVLEAHSWPGNVRELRNLMERALILCDGTQIEPPHLPLDRARAHCSARPVHAVVTRQGASTLRDEVKTLERGRIELALEECDGNQRRAAQKLGLSRGALLRRLEALQISRPRKGS